MGLCIRTNLLRPVVMSAMLQVQGLPNVPAAALERPRLPTTSCGSDLAPRCSRDGGSEPLQHALGL